MRRPGIAIILLMLLLTYCLPLEGASVVKLSALSGTTGLTVLDLFQNKPDLKGWELSIEIVKNVDLQNAKIIAGETDFAFLPTNLAALLYNKKVPVQIAAVSNWGVNYLIGSEASIKTWADLKGKTVALPTRGATPDILTDYFLRKHNLSGEVNIEHINNPVELTQLMIAGRVKLGVLPEPWVSEALSKNSGLRILLDYQEEWKRIRRGNFAYPQTCLIIRRDFARKNPRVASRVLNAISRSSRRVNSHPGEAAPLAQAYLQISANAARTAIPRCNLDFRPVKHVKKEVQEFLNILYDMEPEYIGGRLPDENIFFAP